MAPERAQLREQSYDFGRGELRTVFDFDAGDVRAELEVLTFCSRTMPTLVLQELRVSVSRACDVVLTAGVDTTGVPGTMKARSTRTRGSERQPVDGSLRWESHGAIGLAGVAYVTELDGVEAERSVDENELAPLATRYSFRGRSGRRYRLRQIASVVPDTMHQQPDLQAVRLVYAGTERGFDRLRTENAAAWDDIWRGRIQVDAPARWQAHARRGLLLPPDLGPRIVTRRARPCSGSRTGRTTTTTAVMSCGTSRCSRFRRSS